MSGLKVKQIKAKLMPIFEQYLDLADISPSDVERDAKVLTRCLAALAVYHQTGCGVQEAANSVWDGSDDNGIDAAYFDATEQRVILVQSKWINKGSGEPEAKEISTFVKGVRDIVEQDYTDFDSRLHARLSEIGRRIATPGTSVHLILISTGASSLAKHGQSVLTKCLRELNGTDTDPIASQEVMGLAEVYGSLANDPMNENVTVDANILEWSYVAAPYPAYFGVIDGLQLKEWWRKHGRRLVSRNIRHSLGATDVNNQIRSTALSSPELFWYFNNGVTLVAEEATKAPAGAASRSAGIFSFKAASIVNGAQTVSSLAKLDKDESLGKVRVSIRVILLKATPAEFGNDVTRTNNLQNRIEARDFVAQDPEHWRLRQEMAIEGVDYQYVRTDDAGSSDDSCELIEVTTALACASGDAGLAVIAKANIGRYFDNLARAPYKSIFNSSTSGARSFNATLLQRVVDLWIEERKRSIQKKSGVPWGVLVHGNRILAGAVFRRYGRSKLEQPIADFRGLLERDLSDVHKLCEGNRSLG